MYVIPTYRSADNKPVKVELFGASGFFYNEKFFGVRIGQRFLDQGLRMTDFREVTENTFNVNFSNIPAQEYNHALTIEIAQLHKRVLELEAFTASLIEKQNQTGTTS